MVATKFFLLYSLVDFKNQIDVIDKRKSNGKIFSNRGISGKSEYD